MKRNKENTMSKDNTYSFTTKFSKVDFERIITENPEALAVVVTWTMKWNNSKSSCEIVLIPKSTMIRLRKVGLTESHGYYLGVPSFNEQGFIEVNHQIYNSTSKFYSVERQTENLSEKGRGLKLAKELIEKLRTREKGTGTFHVTSIC